MTIDVTEQVRTVKPTQARSLADVPVYHTRDLTHKNRFRTMRMRSSTAADQFLVMQAGHVKPIVDNLITDQFLLTERALPLVKACGHLLTLGKDKEIVEFVKAKGFIHAVQQLEDYFLKQNAEQNKVAEGK